MAGEHAWLGWGVYYRRVTCGIYNGGIDTIMKIIINELAWGVGFLEGILRML